jgi:signal transduction histidine kinase
LNLSRYNIDTSESEKILLELNDGLDIQESSSNLMSSMIQDLLDYSQIRAGKFRKNISSFNIRDTVNQVMKIQ